MHAHTHGYCAACTWLDRTCNACRKVFNAYMYVCVCVCGCGCGCGATQGNGGKLVSTLLLGAFNDTEAPIHHQQHGYRSGAQAGADWFCRHAVMPSPRSAGRAVVLWWCALTAVRGLWVW